MEFSTNQAMYFYTNKTSLTLMKEPYNSVWISRNKTVYYSGLAVVPNDVVPALGTWASVGKKAGEKKGGSRYRESVAGAEWDSFWRGSFGAAVMLGWWSSAHVGRRQ